MKRTLRQVFGIAGLAGILILAPWNHSSAQTATERQIAEMQQRIAHLTTRIKALEGIEQKVTQLITRLQVLEGAVQVTGGEVKIQSATNLTLQTGSTLTIQGGAMVDIKGGMLKLNNGNKPVARVGDRVNVQTASGTAVGYIMEGSPTTIVQ